jgi:hypothetical protein
VPAEQVCPGAQTFPQAPQFDALVSVSVHVPPQNDWPDGQVHLLLWQVWPPEHVTPQAPQFVELEVVSTQAPPHSA